MKKIITTFVSTFLAIVVLLSTMSFTVNIRYCDDNIVATTLNSEHDPCQTDILNELEDCCIPKKDCCQEAEIIFDGQEEIRVQGPQKIKIDSYIYLVFPIEHTFAPEIKNTLDSLVYSSYSPPFITKDRPILHQVFLI